MAISESTALRYELRDPDVRLMLEVRNDNAAAFEELVVRYQGRLLTVLEHLVGRRDLAEDLTQDVFLRVYRSRKNYVPGSKFSTWLFTIANNVALNALRSRSRRREINIDNSRTTAENSGGIQTIEHMAQAASGMMPTRQLDRTEIQDVVREAIGQLNERQRLAVLLSRFEEMSYEDIAQTMELTPQAVKSLLSRARVNLRQALEPYLKP